MGDSSVTPRLGSLKALLGIVAGAGASYGIYKLISRHSIKKNKKSVTSESAGDRISSQPSDSVMQPGSLLARVSGMQVICPQRSDASSSKNVTILFNEPYATICIRHKRKIYYTYI